jgi:hypothetical protein
MGWSWLYRSRVANQPSSEDLSGGQDRRMSNSENLKAVAAVILIAMAAFGCKSLSEPHTIKSKDGKYEITVPGNMSESPGLNKDAQLTAANRLSELYVFVLTNKKSDYSAGHTLDRHAEVLRNATLKELTESDSTTPEKVTIDGNEARRYRVTGKRDGVKLAYFMTIVETADDFHHIWTWTEGSKAGENEPILNRIADSFHINN